MSKLNQDKARAIKVTQAYIRGRYMSLPFIGPNKYGLRIYTQDTEAMHNIGKDVEKLLLEYSPPPGFNIAIRKLEQVS
jgi:hypothetical protein